MDLEGRITQLERRLDNLEYLVRSVHRRTDEIQQATDARMDAHLREHLTDRQIEELLKAVYDVGRRLEQLEKRGAGM